MAGRKTEGTGNKTVSLASDELLDYATDPARIADEIERALREYGIGDDRRLFRAINFFEGELRLIVRALRQRALTAPDCDIIEQQRAKIERLTAALRQIRSLNDNPAVYNPNIEPVLDEVLNAKP